MSFPHPFHESQPQVKLETFEDLTTVRRAVGEVRGFDDPVTTELRDDTLNSLDQRGFQPKSYVGDEAKTIVSALKTVAKSRDDELALSAADTLKRMPLRLRAATFMTSIIRSPEAPKPPEAPKGPRFPMYDPTSEKTYPEVTWKSKYDSAGQKTQSYKR